MTCFGVDVYEKDDELVAEDEYVLKHYKDMIDELINKMDEDGPANAHGGVDMNPTGKKSQEKK